MLGSEACTPCPFDRRRACAHAVDDELEAGGVRVRERLHAGHLCSDARRRRSAVLSLPRRLELRANQHQPGQHLGPESRLAPFRRLRQVLPLALLSIMINRDTWAEPRLRNGHRHHVVLDPHGQPDRGLHVVFGSDVARAHSSVFKVVTMLTFNLEARDRGVDEGGRRLGRGFSTGPPGQSATSMSTAPMPSTPARPLPITDREDTAEVGTLDYVVSITGSSDSA